MLDQNQAKTNTGNPDAGPIRPEAPGVEGGTPAPEELTGRASKTDDSLNALFDNDSAEHFADGFRGGSDDDKDVSPRKDDDTAATGEESGTAV